MYRQAFRRLALRLGLLTMLALMALAGGGRRSPSVAPCRRRKGKPCAPANTAPRSSSPRSPSASVRDGQPTHLRRKTSCVSRANETGGLGFTNIREVYEPNRTGSPDVAEAPEDIVGWFRRHPYVQTTEPEPATVGGVEGVRFDAVVGDYLSVPRIRDKNTTLLSTESRTKRRSSC
jgi:hypothetical protein